MADNIAFMTMLHGRIFQEGRGWLQQLISEAADTASVVMPPLLIRLQLVGPSATALPPPFSVPALVLLLPPGRLGLSPALRSSRRRGRS